MGTNATDCVLRELVDQLAREPEPHELFAALPILLAPLVGQQDAWAILCLRTLPAPGLQGDDQPAICLYDGLRAQADRRTQVHELGTALARRLGQRMVAGPGHVLRERLPGAGQSAPLALCFPCSASGTCHGLIAVTDERAGEAHAETLVMVADLVGLSLHHWIVKQELRSSGQRARDLFEQMPIGLYRTTPDGRFIDVNRALVEVLGYPERAALLARPAQDGYLEEDERPRWQAQVERLGELKDYETRWRRYDGSTVCVRETARVVRDAHGAVLYYDGAVQDITAQVEAAAQREQLQAQLLQAQKMEGIGHLAAGIAHDFNNLLSPILTYGELLLAELGADPQRRADLQELVNAAEQARQLTWQLLAFSSKQPLQPRVLDLNTLLDGFSRMLRRLVSAGIVLTLRPGQRVPLVRADATQLQQVLMNLVVNAGDAMPGGGQLTIATDEAVIGQGPEDAPRAVQPGRWAMLTVADTGHGMDAAVLSHLFEPFFTTKRREHGTGLGLATAYGIVKQHGGHILVDSERNRGTTFTVYLPAADEHTITAAPAAPVVPLGGGAGELILVAEDDDVVRRLVSGILARQGYRVLAARDAVEALHLTTEHDAPIDLLLTDVVMPGQDGHALYLQLAAARPGLRVLYMSGYAGDVLASHGLRPGELCFLAKPFTVERLTAKVREALGR